MNRKVIGITVGDAAGIGLEVARKAFDSGKLNSHFEYRIIGEIVACEPGKPTQETARAAFDALEAAAALALKNEIAAVVTAPISKSQLYAAGFDFPGQTEFFAARCGVENFAMCLTGGALTVALVTCHVALREVPPLITKSEIVRVGSLLADFLALRLGNKRAPRIAVAGLNPHAGEAGALGREEIEIIEPAIAELNRSFAVNPSLTAGATAAESSRLASGETSSLAKTGTQFFGPLPPDTLFHRAVAGEFDGALCMYHDQGLIPLKLHAFDEGVNVTLGLPIIRTSPDHGTAFDIAGKNLASPNSMIAAINLAAELAERSENPVS